MASFWISTGDIKQSYVPVNIATTFVAIDQPAFGSIDFGARFKKAIDNLAHEAQRLGGNGVIWISFAPRPSD